MFDKTTKERGYTIRQYPADGCSLPSALYRTSYESIAAAKAAIIAEFGDHGEWIDEAGYTCLHESGDEGCGGFAICPAH